MSAPQPVPLPPAPPPQTRAVFVWAPAVVVFALATVGVYWPTVYELDRARPHSNATLKRYSDTLSAPEPAKFGQYIERFAEHARVSPWSVFSREVCFPEVEFDCPMTFLFPCGLVKWATNWPSIRILNLFTLVAVLLNAIGAFGFLRALGVSAPVAVATALGFVAPNFVPYSHFMGHVNYVQLQWIAFAFWALVETMRPDTTRRPAVALGLAMGMQLLSSPSFSLFLAYIALPVFAVTLWLTTKRAERLTVRALAVRALIAVAVAFVVALPYLAARFALMPPTYSVPSKKFTWYEFGNLLDPGHPTLFVGKPLLILGAMALVWVIWSRKPVGIALFLTMVACALCMLPDEPWRPFHILREYAPLFNRMRVPMRFFPLAFLMLLGLIAAFLSAITERHWSLRWLASVALVAVFALGQWWHSPWVYAPDEQLTP